MIVILDIDECEQGLDGCDHNCTNTVGRYYCTCMDGYELESDNHTCTGNNNLATMYPCTCIQLLHTVTSSRLWMFNWQNFVTLKFLIVGINMTNRDVQFLHLSTYVSISCFGYWEGRLKFERHWKCYCGTF